ncbi:hypothetical protein GCM10027020_30510 [Nocardioides salsibiostraticola]
MDSQIIIVVAVAAVIILVLLAVGVALLATRRKRVESDRLQAAELRSEAVANTGGLQQAEQQVRVADHEAEGRRLEAEKAEAKAAEARRVHAAEEASIEDQVRRADRVDPDVNHRAKDYTPQNPATSDGHSPDHRAPAGERVPTHADTTHPTDSVVNADGTITYPDGSIRNHDGSTVDPGA